jgi:putative peptide zinc metalloprotease protein
MTRASFTQPQSPRLRGDLVVSRQPANGTVRFVVKDPATGRFFRFREIEGFILQQLDGRTSLAELLPKVESAFGAALSLSTLEQFVERLRHLALLADEASAQFATPPQPGRIRGDALYLRLNAFDPDPMFDRLVGKMRFFFTTYFVGSSAALIVFAFSLTVANWSEIAADVQRLYNVESLLVVWVTVFLVIIAHECAHGLTCKYHGGSVHEVGFLFLYFQPTFYCNVSDAWLFPEKSKRLWVTFAGAYFELFLWACATLLWRVTDPSAALNHLALVVMATSGVKSLFNLNPLIKLDGYYLLSDYLDIPNLRQRAFRYLGSSIKRWASPGERPMQASPGERRIYVVYGALAGLYSYSLLGLVVWWVGSSLVQWYRGWGFVLFTGLLLTGFRTALREALRRAPGVSAFGPRKAGVMNRRIAVVTGLGIVAALLFLVPMELKVAGEFKVLPIRQADVRAEVEGIIEHVYVDEGQAVGKDDAIAQLSGRDYRAELQKLGAETDEKQAMLKMLKAGPRAEEVTLARAAVQKAEERLKYGKTLLGMLERLFTQDMASRKEYAEAQEQVAVRTKELDEANGRLTLLLAGSRPEKIEAIEAEIARLKSQQTYLEEQLQRVKIVSPVAGVVTTPKLKDKIGQYVHKGDLVAEVHELGTVTAEIAIPEKEIADVRLGAEIALKARAFPGVALRGTVASIAPIVTRKEPSPLERTVAVTTRLDNSGLLLKPGMTGQAKVFCGKRRLFDLVTRALIRYLRVEFWSWW